MSLNNHATPYLLSNYVAVPETGCWLWLGAWNRGRYGDARKHGGKRRALAHRMFFAVYKGDIPKGMEVCHKCDTPPCVNPDHLFLGTHKDNMRDCSRKGRIAGDLKRDTKLNTEKVILIRERVMAGESRRALGREFGVNENAIRQVISGRTWSFVKSPAPLSNNAPGEPGRNSK